MLSALLLGLLSASDLPDPDTLRSSQGIDKCFLWNPRREVAVSNESIVYPTNARCDGGTMPAAWQKGLESSSVMDYDLAIVGAGMGGAYLVDRLLQLFQKAGQPAPKIALFEKSDVVGGRLMSAWGAGALSLGSSPAVQSLQYPLPEYGGMRIDPTRYPLLFNKIVEYATRMYGPSSCLPAVKCTAAGQNCCEKMLVPMDVGGIRYVTTNSDASPWMRSSTAQTKSEIYTTRNGVGEYAYNTSSIAQGVGSPYDTCLQLIVGAEAYSKKVKDEQGTVWPATGATWKVAITDLCNNHCSVIQGMCALCDKFRKDGQLTAPQAGISCTGYDFPVETALYAAITGLADEVVNLEAQTKLYLLRHGFQRFAMSLLQGPMWDGVPGSYTEKFKGKSYGISPLFGKILQKVELINEGGSTLDTDQLVQTHLAGETQAAASGVKLTFGDNSVVKAKAAYLAMLPRDMAAIQGLGAFDARMDEFLIPGGAMKILMTWDNAEDTPQHKLGMSSCLQSPCQRLILDGGSEWIVRQVWFWDFNTIMIYDIAAGYDDVYGDGQMVYPANRVQQMSAEKGMDHLIKTATQQIREATGLNDLKDPDWARLKSWPPGELSPGFLKSDRAEINNFVDQLERPLGVNQPVFYGSSEASRSDLLHGWAEGALEMVEDNMPALTQLLGLNTPFVPYPKDPETGQYDSNAIALAQWQEAMDMVGDVYGDGEMCNPGAGRCFSATHTCQCVSSNDHSRRLLFSSVPQPDHSRCYCLKTADAA